MDELVKYLTTFGLEKSQVQIFASIFRKKVVLEKGDIFIKEGKVCKELGFITKGMCRHFYNTQNDEVTRWVVLENEFITSLSSFITQKASDENIQAIKPTELLIASKKDWEHLKAEHEFVRTLWTETIEENYVGMETRVFNFIALSAEERYNWMLEHQPKFNTYVPDKYVASMLGIKPRHLSRIRTKKK